MTEEKSESENNSSKKEQFSDESTEDSLEIAEVLEDLPPDAKEVMATFLSMQRVTPYVSPIVKKINAIG